MTELEWDPSKLQAMTVPQLVCLVNEKPPHKGRKVPVTSAEGLARVIDEKKRQLKAEEDEWQNGI
jgi:hypothetical protein